MRGVFAGRQSFDLEENRYAAFFCFRNGGGPDWLTLRVLQRYGHRFRGEKRTGADKTGQGEHSGVFDHSSLLCQIIRPASTASPARDL